MLGVTEADLGYVDTGISTLTVEEIRNGIYLALSPVTGIVSAVNAHVQSDDWPHVVRKVAAAYQASLRYKPGSVEPNIVQLHSILIENSLP